MRELKGNICVSSSIWIFRLFLGEGVLGSRWGLSFRRTRKLWRIRTFSTTEDRKAETDAEFCM